MRRLRGGGGGLDARLDADDRHVRMGGAQRLDGRRGGGIAGERQRVAALVYEVTADGQHPAADEVFGFRAIGHVRGMAGCMRSRVRHGADDGCQHRKAADARVENSDHDEAKRLPRNTRLIRPRP